MGPKVWKSSDLEQQGLGGQQHNAPTEPERATLLEAAPVRGRELLDRASNHIHHEGTSPALPGGAEPLNG